MHRSQHSACCVRTPAQHARTPARPKPRSQLVCAASSVIIHRFTKTAALGGQLINAPHRMAKPTLQGRRRRALIVHHTRQILRLCAFLSTVRCASCLLCLNHCVTVLDALSAQHFIDPAAPKSAPLAFSHREFATVGRKRCAAEDARRWCVWRAVAHPFHCIIPSLAETDAPSPKLTPN